METHMDWMELRRRGGIYFKEIRTGFSEYQSEIKRLSGAEALKTFEKMWKEVYPNQTYVDFYYYRLDNEAKQRVEEVLEKAEVAYLKQGYWKEQEELKEQKDLKIQEDTSSQEESQPDSSKEAPIIFSMDEMLLSITTKLNEQEVLFSTIYFAGERGKRSTWWGNYNQEYVVFTDREE